MVIIYVGFRKIRASHFPRSYLMKRGRSENAGLQFVNFSTIKLYCSAQNLWDPGGFLFTSIALLEDLPECAGNCKRISQFIFNNHRMNYTPLFFIFIPLLTYLQVMHILYEYMLN